MISFAATIFLGAFLLFQIELTAAKFLLPWYGGAPAVWTTCMLFFQVVLLGGYGMAHASGRRNGKTQGIAQIVLASASLLLLVAQWHFWKTPLLPPGGWRPTPESPPVPQLLLTLAAAVGLPCLVLSSTSPLVQKWFFLTWPDRSPYRLYALSNAGSLLGLLSYPFVIEPAFNLRQQAVLLASAFFVFVLSLCRCAWRVARVSNTRANDALPARPANRPGRGVACLWLILSACASAMLLSTTNMICQDIAVVPLLWVLPLSLYLLAFILCFGREKNYSRRDCLFALAAASVAICVLLIMGPSVTITAQIFVISALLFIACMVCNGELARLKPPPEHLTSFYLLIATGGAAGGVFVSLLAPAIFNGFWEFHFSLWLLWTLVPVLLIRDTNSIAHRGAKWIPGFLIFSATAFVAFLFSPQALAKLRPAFGHFSALAWLVSAALFALICICAIHRPRARARLNPESPAWFRAGLVLFWGLLSLTLLLDRLNFSDGVKFASRNFFGVLRVTDDTETDPAWRHFSLRNGRISHGRQFVADNLRALPTMYYTEQSGAGIALREHPRAGHGMKIAAIGLGVGTVACYGKPGDEISFYEINPAVIAMNRRADFFTYVRDVACPIRIIPGDARIALEHELRAPDAVQFDVIIADAFTGDSIPVHLLTREAAELYLRRLASGGVLCLHTSNRHLDLVPVVAAIAAQLNLEARRVKISGDDHRASSSEWILLFRKGENVGPAIAQAGKPLAPPPEDFRPWTDDFSSLLEILR